MIADTLILDRGVSAGDAWITVPSESIRDALSGLRSEGYLLLTFLTCVDHLADASRGGAPGEGLRPAAAQGGPPPVDEWPARFEIVYQLRNLDSLEQLRVRAFVDGDPPKIDSVQDMFPPANWDERETYDLFGIVFNDHPDLTRILMPDDWVGHPLRRDYPVGGETVEFSQEHEKWQTAPEDA
ncbi:MAG TPA: NADH-quinone oxidoreductase subunit C [Candidatus Dormibacteraeota bacterium]